MQTSRAEFDSNKPFAELATPDDLPALKLLVNLANEYSQQLSEGQKQWNLIDRVEGQLADHVNAGELYVVRDFDGDINAAMAISEHDAMWPDADNGAALYVHKLMKRPTLDGQPHQVGARFLRFAALKALESGKAVLRCDVKQDLSHLVAYYERFGFTTKGEVTYAGTEYKAHLMEAPAVELVSYCETVIAS